MTAVVALALGGCSFVGGAPKEPVLGTRDVCSLFDAGKLNAAVPDGDVKLSELSRHNDLGNAGTCEFSNRTESSADGDFAELRFEVYKAFDKNAAEAHEDAVGLLGNTCRLPPLTAPVQGPDEGPAQWCEWNEPNATSNINGHYSYAVRRDLMVVSVEYEYRGPVDVARVERARQDTRAAAESAFP
ncbi:hypothetical protein ACFO1B_39595 [Dactylosporangium siamense]|uniref:hypothetical protein n=1 Tax=Dactylosporangium siamense TaxID=685454 RepID=UPI00194345D2|nr:hypothetical protein [Dactylosporangium siamense]